MNGSDAIEIRRASMYLHGVLLDRAALPKPWEVTRYARFSRTGVELDEFQWTDGESKITGTVHGVPVSFQLSIGPAKEETKYSLLFPEYQVAHEISVTGNCLGSCFDNAAEFLFLGALAKTPKSLYWEQDFPNPQGPDDLLKLGREFAHRAWIVLHHARTGGESLPWNSPPLMPHEAESERRYLLESLQSAGALERTDTGKARWAPSLATRMTDAYRAALLAEIPAIASLTGPEGQS